MNRKKMIWFVWFIYMGKTKPYRAARQNEGQDKKYARKGTVSPLVGLSVKKISKTSKIGKTTLVTISSVCHCE